MRNPVKTMVIGNRPDQMVNVARSLRDYFQVLDLLDTKAAVMASFSEDNKADWPEMLVICDLHLMNNPRAGGFGEDTSVIVEDLRTQGFKGIILPCTKDQVVIANLVGYGADDPVEYDISFPAALAMNAKARLREEDSHKEAA